MKLRPYQQQGVNTLYNALALERNVLCVMGTGMGKTEVFIALAKKAGVKTAVLVGRNRLVSQTVRRMLPHFNDVGIWSAAEGVKRVGDVTVVSIHSADTLTIPGLRFMICDEAHNLNDGRYKQFIDRHPDAKLAGFTATPWRNGVEIFGEGKVFSRCHFKRGILKGIEDGFLVPPVSKAMPKAWNTEGLHIRGDDFKLSDINKLVSDKAKTKAQVEDAMSRLTDRNKIVWMCASIEHAELVANMIPETSSLVHSKQTNNDYQMECFEEGDVRHMVSVMMLSEGYDFPAIDSIILLRPTRSPTLYCLDSETEILTSNGWKKMGEVSIGDCVSVMDMMDGSGKWSRVLNYIERDLENDENFVAYNAPRCNFRVTANHRMIYKTGKNREWTIDEARKLPLYKDNIYIPSAVEIKQPGVPLRDCEIYFIGMMMSDGSWTNVCGTIYQSARYPKVVERIEKCLLECGISYSKRLQKIDNKNSYIQKYERYVFSFSAGKPRKSKARTFTGGTGYRHLLPYMDKDLSTMLMSMSKSQFLLLVQGIWDGDGSKKKNVDYTPRSWEICSARKHMVDRLQALASIHGFTANLRVEKGRSRAKPIYVITISPQSWRSIHGYGKRPKVHFQKSHKKERVWCVETEHGTIVTRRNGKVTVMGNCQIVGRGLRPAEGKKDCLVLDYGEVIKNCGPLHDPFTKEARKKAGDKEPLDKTLKVCPNCLSYVEYTAAECPDCQHELKVERDPTKSLTSKAGDIDIMSREPERLPCYGVKAVKHQARSGNQCIKLQFDVGKMWPINIYGSSHPFSWGKARQVINRLTPWDFQDWQECYDACEQLVFDVPEWVETEIKNGFQTITRISDRTRDPNLARKEREGLLLEEC